MKKKKGISLSIKTAAGIILLAFILSSAAILFGYSTYKKTLDSQLIEIATHVANTMVSQVEPESIDRYLETGKTDAAYDAVHQILQDIQINNVISYAVVTKPTEEGFYYIYDTDQGEEAFQLGDFQEFYPGKFLDNKERFLAGESIKPIITNYEFGWLLSILTPIKDADGKMHGYVDVDISMNHIKEQQRSFLVQLTLIMLTITTVLVIIFLVLIRRFLTRPINDLAAAAGEFVDMQEAEMMTQTHEIMELPRLDTGDELGNLYRSIRQMESDIYSYIEYLTAVTAEKERIGAELNVATHIQASMLPCIFPAFPEREEFDIYASMQPAKEVGGDFYDFFLVDENHLAIVIADVSGKGVPAALFMVIAKTLIKNHTQNKENPADVFTFVNTQLCENNEEGMFVTAWMGVMNIVTGEFIYVNAGHNPPLLKRRTGAFEYMKTRPGFVLAGIEGMKYKQNEMRLEPGDILYLYTDGVTEATDTYDQLYGEDRLKAVLDRNADQPLDGILSCMKEDIDSFVKGAPQFDDITMLMLRIGSKEA